MSKQSQQNPDHMTQRAPSDHLGPDYKPADQKPTATVSSKVSHENVTILPQTPQLIALLTMIRDKNTNRADFIFYSNRINRLLVEEALNHLPVHPHTVTTPVGRPYAGVAFEGKICGVSIMRAGEAMEQALRECCRSVRIGKILIQRDEETSNPRLFYDKLPEDVGERWVLLLDPMLATGGSALMAVDVLRSKGVPESRICFLNLIASPEGAANFAQKFPKVRIVTAFVDEGLNEKKYVSPAPSTFRHVSVRGRSGQA
ncbi:Uracil phosphoribosyltransferase, synthesizes UMP from uracil [Friedmanniomyces endolithicus]|nr:Uracil phosphoribosyltransferase, synthesizes UMP from uracil [Friedmanniomyces endolithicus]KAK0776158.1 Uracil phosphoribosyltransferase, synthesizes UMP from uracil [Friedmanniomyces endolithicus]KAK0800296.1 Uracil phosphoribosyltransferase, synthesizes UMP from uracil [Friedmanniomyces endolithicus]KAK0810882.1 Uracil phosphoribosyltransferase, synthesizes UMP from uracil [Friedmanniomyces endolithicus]KAK0829597.1 Uracil phosphoribosyltransferase, synthesizes UMP from uracil [Friedmann